MSTPLTVDLRQTVCTNPATGAIIGYSQINTPEEARDALRRARAAQPAWSALPLTERQRYIARIRDYLVDHADAVSDTISKDVGKTRVEGLRRWRLKYSPVRWRRITTAKMPSAFSNRANCATAHCCS